MADKSGVIKPREDGKDEATSSSPPPASTNAVCVSIGDYEHPEASSSSDDEADTDKNVRVW